MSEKRIWSQKSAAIKASHANFKITSEVWSLFDKDVRSRVLFTDIERFFRALLSFLNISQNPQQSKEFLQQVLYLIQLNQHESFAGNDVVRSIFEFSAKDQIHTRKETLTSQEMVTSIVSLIDFDTFYDLLIVTYCFLVLNSKPEFFKTFWEYIFVNVVEIHKDETLIEIDCSEVKCLSNTLIKDEATFTCFFIAEIVPINASLIYSGSGELNLTKKVVTTNFTKRIGKATHLFLQEVAANVTKHSRTAQVWNEVKEIIQSEEKFYTFFCINAGAEKLYLSLAVRDSHWFELVSPKNGGEAFYKNLMEGEFYQEINYTDRFTKLFNSRKNPYGVEQVKSLGFENESRSIAEQLIKANKLADKVLPQVTSIAIQETTIDQAKECLVYADGIEGVENQINELDLKVDPLEGIRSGDWIKDNLLALSFERPLRLLVVGKRFTGKSQLTKVLAKILKIEYVDIDDLVSNYLKDLVTKMTEYDDAMKEYQAGADPETGANPNQPPEAPFGAEELEALSNGQALSLNFIQTIFHRKITEFVNSNKGYVIEYSSLFTGQNFFKFFKEAQSNETPIIEYMINLKLGDEDSIGRAKQTFEMIKASEGEDPLLIYTNQSEIKERELQRQRAEFLKDSDGMTETQREVYDQLNSELREFIENADNYVPYPKNQLHKGLACHESILADQLSNFNCFEISAIKDYAIQNQLIHVPVDIEGKNMRDILKTILAKIRYPKFKPVVEIEGASSLSALQEADRNLDNGEARRFWSFYKNIDCVELVDNKFIKVGLAENSVDYQNYIFVFVTADNKAKFLLDPKRYIKEFPTVDGKMNLAVFSPANLAIDQLVAEIAAQYKLKLVNLTSYLNKLLKTSENGVNKIDGKLFWSTEDYYLNLQDLLTGILSGTSVSCTDLIKLFMLENGFQMEIKFDPDAELKTLTEKVDPKAKKRIIKKEPKPITLAMLVTPFDNLKAKAEFYERVKSSGEVPEDVTASLPDLSGQIAAGPSLKKGYLFHNAVGNKDDLNFIESFGLTFDKVVSFAFKNSDEDKILKVDKTSYDIDKYFTLFEEFSSHLKSAYSSDTLLEIDYTEKEASFFKIKIIDFIDPFKSKIDSEDLRCNYDFAGFDNGKELAMYGSFGRLCPVSLIDRKWFYFCNPVNNNTQIDNRIYCFATEASKEKFQRDYLLYLDSLSKINFEEFAKEQARVFVMGAIGSGLRSLSKVVSEVTGLELIDLKAELLRQKKDYIKQQMLMKLLTSGFNCDDFEEKDALLREIDSDSPTISSKYEPADSDVDAKFELDLLEKLLLSSQKKVVMLELFFNEEEQIIFKGNVKEMMATLNLVPDHAIILKSGEFTTLNRLYNKDELKKKLENKLDLIRVKNKETIENKRNELYQEKLEEDKKAQIEDIEVNEADLELQPEFDIEEELEKTKTSIITRREAQIDLIKDFVEQFKEPETDIYQVTTEVPLTKLRNAFVNFWDKICTKRRLHIHHSQIVTVRDNEDNLEISCVSRIDRLMKTGYCRLSSFGKRNCLKPQQVLSNFDYNFIFNGEMFFVSNEEELAYIKSNPQFLINKASVYKLDLITPKITFLQLVADQKLRKSIEDKLGLTIISLSSIIQKLFYSDSARNTEDYDLGDFDIKFTQLSSSDLQIPELFSCIKTSASDLAFKTIQKKILRGDKLSDSQKVYLVYKAIRSASESERGYVLEEFPENTNQLRMLASLGCLPRLVFNISYSEAELRNINAKGSPIFEYDETFAEIIKHKMADANEIEHFFNRNFQNLFVLNPAKSWVCNMEIISSLIDASLEGSFQAVKLFNEHKPYGLGMLPVSSKFIEKSAPSEGRISLAKSFEYHLNSVCAYQYEQMQYFQGKCLFDCKNYDISVRKAKANNSNQFIAPKEWNLPTSELTSMLLKPSKTLTLHSNYEEFCPVCNSKNILKSGLESLRLSVDKSTHILFCSLPHLHEFFRAPKLFLAKSLDPKKLTAERTAASTVIDIQKKLIDEIALIMNHVCQMKLKHPGLTIKKTALALTSIFLKLRNPLKSTAYRQKYEAKLQSFMRSCKETDKISQQMKIDFKILSKFEKENLSKQIKELFSTLDQLKAVGQRTYFDQFIF